MNVPLNELIAALPREDTSGERVFAREEMERIFEDLAMRPAPTGSLQRLWNMSELSVQVALAYSLSRIRGWFADAAGEEQRKLETNLRIALKIVHRLSYMRGALMKAGQAAACFPGILPSEILSTLEDLHFDAPPMHYTLIREVLINELGSEPEDLFQNFERQAFAAASIGQVHRATLKSGERVAVKIQYPGIARTIDADIRNLVALMLPLRLGRNWDGLRAALEEVHRVLKLEADYRLEAKSLGKARALFQDSDGIVIPRVYERYSGERVLTMEYLQGQHLPDYLATLPAQESRNEFGTKMCSSWYRMFIAGLSYCDPHAGNYLFMDDGRLGLLDFGCVLDNPAQAERLSVYHSVYESDQSTPDLCRAFIELGLNPDDLQDERYRAVVDESVRWTREPFEKNGPFDYGDPQYLRRRALWLSSAAGHGHALADDASLVYFTTATLKMAALLYQLRAQVNMKSLPMDQWWSERSCQ
ncbi:MAG TPA: AarF/ABC1/UbiB kinase family protein [Bryobacteraceae bacterium]|jgi:predicted unusual protein kinase regulating ubiquinone biosynthesis (AarF/ABC1/UbiB family)